MFGLVEKKFTVVMCLLISLAVSSAVLAGSISGQVTDVNGVPLENVWVTLYTGTDPNIADEDVWNWVSSTQTSLDGEYQFDGLAERRYRIHIEGQEISSVGYLEADLYQVQVFEGANTPNMNFRLRKAALIYGYVTTSTGTPIPNANVIAEVPWTHYGWDWHNTYTDSDGLYKLWVASSPGKFYPVWVRDAALGYVSYESKWDGNLYKATFEGTRVDFVLERAGTVTGRVVNESGVGIEDVRVTCGWNKYGLDEGDWLVTDSDGYFELGGLPAGTVYVYLDNGWREIQQDGVKYMVGEAYIGPITISAGATLDVGTFTIYEAGMVSGIVTDEAGFPVEGVEVELDGQDIEGNWADRDEVYTDSFGQFTIDYIAPGIYRLTCERGGFIPTVKTDIRVNRGEHVDLDIVLRSAAQGARISGRISNYSDVASYDSENGVYYPYYDDSDYDEFGLPDFGLVAVSMKSQFTDSDYLNIDNSLIGFVDEYDINDGYGDYFQTDANETPGNYNTFLPPGDIAVAMYISREGDLSGPGNSVVLYDWKRFNLTKGDAREDVNFTAVTTNTGTLKGDISVPPGYDYFPEGWCLIYAYALDINDNIKTAIPVGDAIAFPDWETKYQISNLPAGKYKLKAYARNLASVLSLPPVTVNINQTTILNIPFTAGSTLIGHVTDANTAIDIEGAVVAIVQTGGQATTDEVGDYNIVGINPGIYTIKVNASDYADVEVPDVNIPPNLTVIRDIAMYSIVGSISGTVKINAPGEPNINGATVVAYNEVDATFKTSETVGGAFSITDLTPGEYILAVNTGDYGYGVVIYPPDGSSITLPPNGNVSGIDIRVETVQPPVFSVFSTVSTNGSKVLSMEFCADPNLLAAPDITVITGDANSLGALTSNAALNRFNIEYTIGPSDDIVQIEIAETTPRVAGNPASKTFTFEVSTNLVQTGSTNVTNATGGEAKMMGTQDNTNIYVPPFAIVGADDTQALTLTIERYGDPGDPAPGTDDTTVSAVYDFEFDQSGVSIDVDHVFTVTMSFQLPEGMTQEEFEDSLQIRYFDVGDQQWKTDGISNVRINWLNSTIMFDISHLSSFAAFVTSGPGVTSVEISGPTQVNENSGAQYTCTAYYSDGNTSDVTSSAIWDENSPYATISGTGYLTTLAVPSDQPCRITATFEGKSANYDITIKDTSPILIKKCLVKAGKAAESDMILILGQMNATVADFNDANNIQVTINSNDMVKPCVQNFPKDEKSFKKGKYNYARTEGAYKRLFKFDTKTGKFSFMAKNVDLSGLGCPLTIEIVVGDYVGVGETDEDVVNGPKKLIPIQLMIGVRDTLRVDKCKVTSGKNPSTDSLSVKGALAVEDTSVDLENETVTITWGTQTFTIPIGSFQSKNNTFTCRNVEVAEGGIVSAKFDFIKCSFTIAIKKAVIQSKSGTVNFGIAFGSFNESVEVEL